MNSYELFLALKSEAANILPDSTKVSEHGEEIQSPPESVQYKIQLIAKYNKEIFSEIKSRVCINEIEEIDSDKLKDFIFRINQYMDENAPNQTEFKEYVRIISTYLTFIAKKPLHPPGMIMGDDQMIIEKDDNYYCPVKSKYILEALSLCKYCVAKGFK
jgi:uncharacterized protein (UPF0305 family)